MADLKNEFSWSKSREETFRRCPRQYWFQFYGPGVAWNRRADERTRTLFVLHRLQPRQAWMETTVGNCLRWVIDTLRKTGAPPPEEQTLQHLGRRMNKDYVASGEGAHWEDPAGHRGLIEHEYEERDVPDEDWQELFERALLLVSTFYHSDYFRRLLTVPGTAWLDGQTHREGDGLVVHHWIFDVEPPIKSAAADILLASRKWNVPPDRVIVRAFNLATNTPSDARATAQELSAADAAIAASESELHALHGAPEEKFALTDDDRECARCNFQRICPKFQ